MNALLLSLILSLGTPESQDSVDRIEKLLQEAGQSQSLATKNLATEQLIAMADAVANLRALKAEMKLGESSKLDRKDLQAIAAQIAGYLPFDDLKRSARLLDNSDPVIQMFGVQKLKAAFASCPKLKSDSSADLALRALYQQELSSKFIEIYESAEELKTKIQEKQWAQKNQDLTREILIRFSKN